MIKKKAYAIIAAMCLVTSTIAAPTFASAASQTTDNGVDERLGVPIAVYGANLSTAEKESVQKSLNVNSEVEEITVTGNDIAKYISNGNASARLYSSAKITPKDQGDGLVISIVTPDNITQVTSEMYSNAMLTAGIENATVEVAAPKKVTGHSALAGIYKAYETTTGEKLDTERTNVANEELSVTTDIADNSGVSDEKVSELMTEIKKAIADTKPATKEEVTQIVDDKLKSLEINLSDTDRQLLIDLMDKISKLDIDFSKWSNQLEDLSDQISNSIDKIKEDVNSDDGFWASVKNFFKNLFSKLTGNDSEETE